MRNGATSPRAQTMRRTPPTAPSTALRSSRAGRGGGDQGRGPREECVDDDEQAPRRHAQDNAGLAGDRVIVHLAPCLQQVAPIRSIDRQARALDRRDLARPTIVAAGRTRSQVP